MTDQLLDVVSAGVRAYDLARELRIGMPQSPNHPPFWHVVPRRHGDSVRADGGSAANDMITTGTHVGTHIDALAHVSQDGALFGGVDAEEACIGGRYVQHGVHTIEPMIRRGVLVDVAAHLGVTTLDGDHEITLTEFQDALNAQQTEVRKGDVVLIRSGWGAKFDEGQAFVGGATGVPGIGEAVARWLATQGIHAAGADSIAFEHLRPGAGHGLLPVHRLFLVESGIYIIETMNLEQISVDRVYEFTLVLAPLNIFGATGSPVRPLAVVSRG
ncbi:cyclase family protein [Ornithinimicrobium faecis]|uniref:Cyclase family protein n=1 Tax=Ornithinimicrobium faecis TaxID=2934158 RepID=A0ABY4YTM2_9MICO|nr:cyclase family protein [Ornithinimicrobium sp. HY1793]USQ80122.1 cyclase family protein [Ornithinimicrobium sp. HY1793]